MQLRWVTWHNSCASVDDVRNFIVSKDRAEVTPLNRAIYLWKSQDRVIELPVQFV